MNKEEFFNYLRGVLLALSIIFSAITIAFSIWGGIWFIDRQITLYDHKIQYNKLLEDLNKNNKK